MKAVLALTILVTLTVLAAPALAQSSTPSFERLSHTEAGNPGAVAAPTSHDVAKLLLDFLKEPTLDGFLRINREVPLLRKELLDGEKRVLYGLLQNYANALWLKDHTEHLELLEPNPTRSPRSDVDGGRGPVSSEPQTAVGRSKNLSMARSIAQMDLQRKVARALYGEQVTRNADGTTTRLVQGTVTGADYEILRQDSKQEGSLWVVTIEFRLKKAR
ncbi:MAG: hypothetical protein HY814_06110 [Candidatus Riflebacteria bacterium]|nr:hypothetical protein [Candidatus Riflebacteria bacterium]